MERADLDHHLEGLAQEKIADQDAGLIAPKHPRGRLAATQIALVDDVIVEQGRGMHELDRGGELDMPFAAIAATGPQSPG